METTYNSNNYTDSFQHIGGCAEVKTIKSIITIDDGTGKLFEYELNKQLEWKEYDITPGFSTSPQEPTIIGNTTIIPNITDIFDVTKLNGVDYDFGVDGTQTNNQETENVNQILSVPRNQNITQLVRYFTGWETKTREISKNISKTNINPVVSNTLSASCFKVPSETYISNSTDQEDSSQDLVINWGLFLDTSSYVSVTIDNNGEEVRTLIFDNNPTWDLVTSINNSPIFNWTYSTEGQYKLVETAIDLDLGENSTERQFPIVFISCNEEEESKQHIQVKGIIEVEAGIRQFIAIPMTTGYWDKNLHKIVKNSNIKSTIKNTIIDQIEDIYGVSANNLISIINGYTGDENQYRNYIPGFTKDSSIHNFQLVYEDNDQDVQDGNTKYEISGFWLTPKNVDFIIRWGQIE